MRASSFSYLWPGLRPLWVQGNLTGLACALLFAVLLNFGIVVTYIWSEAIPTVAQTALWIGMIGGWGAVTTLGPRWWTGVDELRIGSTEAFQQAQIEYLRGNWIEAELRLLKILDHAQADVDSRLLLATLYRHTKRYKESIAELAKLERYELAVKWQWEISEEKRLLAETAQNEPPPMKPENSIPAAISTVESAKEDGTAA